MPYTKITREGKKFCFKNEETGQKICSDSEHDAIAAMRARYRAHSGKEMTGGKGKPFKVKGGK